MCYPVSGFPQSKAPCFQSWDMRESVSEREICILFFFDFFFLCFRKTDCAAEDATIRYGDVLSLGAAAAIIGYMLVGHKLRQWMPLFLYALPVTFIAAVVLALTSVLVEGAGFFSGLHDGIGTGTGAGARAGQEGNRLTGWDSHHAAIFGWLLDRRSFAVGSRAGYAPQLFIESNPIRSGLPIQSSSIPSNPNQAESVDPHTALENSDCLSNICTFFESFYRSRAMIQ